MRIGFLTSSIDSSYGQALIKSIWRELKARNCSLFIFEGYSLMNNSISDYQCNALFRLISQGRIDALILSSSQLSSKAGFELIQDLATRIDIPAVSLGVELDGIPSVMTNNFSGFEQIVTHLISHHYKKLAHISGPLKNPEALHRRDAFLKVVYQNGLEVPKHFILEGNFSYISGYNLTKKLIPYIRAKEIDAIVCANDDMAFGAVRCLYDNGIAVPEDVAITGFDDATNLLGITQTLTTISQPFDEICKTAVRLLLDEKPEDQAEQNHIIEPCLMIRNSCGCKDINQPDIRDYASPIYSNLTPQGRFYFLDEKSFYSALTGCLNEYCIRHCYIVWFLEPTRLDDYALARQSIKGKLIYGYSNNKTVLYSNPFDVAQILPDSIIEPLEGLTVVMLLFAGKTQFGYIVMTTSGNLAPFIAELCFDVRQYLENTYLSQEKQRVEEKLSDTLERLISTNRKLNQLTVRDNLDKLNKIRYLANNMLQNRELDAGDYYLILVEIDNFLEINANYGFVEGEHIMNSVTGLLSGCIREDDFLSHQNCERYLILIKNIHEDVIKTIEKRFTDNLNDLNLRLGKPYTVSLTWGYAYAGTDSDFEKVYLEAELNLASKKSTSGN